MSRSTAQYIDAQEMKKDPSKYTSIKIMRSWILREQYLYEWFERNVSKNAKILQLGCGRGYFLDQLHGKGYTDLSGIDIANYLPEQKYKHWALDLNRESWVGIKDKSIDVVCCFQTIEHLENYFLVMHEAHRVLKQGGLFIYSVPSPFNIFYRIKFAFTGNVVGWDIYNQHLLFITKDVWKKTYLKKFDLLETFYGKGVIPALGRLNFLPGVHFPARVRVLPRCEALSDRVCYFLKKKDVR